MVSEVSSNIGGNWENAPYGAHTLVEKSFGKIDHLDISFFFQLMSTDGKLVVTFLSKKKIKGQ